MPGQGPIPRPDAGSSTAGRDGNPAAAPITSSSLDFESLVGGDVNTPRVASSLRPDREWIEFQQRKAFADQARSYLHWSPYDRVGVVNADP